MDAGKTFSHQTILECSSSNSFRSRHSHVSDEAAARILRFGVPVGCRVEHHAVISRCMARIQELIHEAEREGSSLESGTIVLADTLKDSSGRFDREWYAPSGGIWMALAWADTLLPEYARLLPLAAGTACCETIQNSGIEARVKWVNDIHVKGCKIGGILCETYSSGITGERYHLIGIGINCNNSRFPEHLRGSAVSMRDLLHVPVDLEKFAVELMASLSWHFGMVLYQEEQELAKRDNGESRSGRGMVVDAWMAVSDTIGRRVVYGYDVIRQPLYSARVKGIERSGALVMELESGDTVTEHSGEIIYLDE